VGFQPFLFAVPPINVFEAYQNVAQVVEELKAEELYEFIISLQFLPTS